MSCPGPPDFPRPAVESIENMEPFSPDGGDYPDVPDPFDPWTDIEWESSGEERPDDVYPSRASHGKPKRDWKAEAMSTEHALTHRPANKYCKTCRRIKSQHKRHRRRLVPKWTELSKFGEIITMDHMDCKYWSSRSARGHKWAVVGLDLATWFLMNRPLRTKQANETGKELRMWRGQDRITHCHSDGSGEIDWVCYWEGISHDITAPGDAQSNGIAEGFVNITKVGTAALLSQAGLTHPYWHLGIAVSRGGLEFIQSPRPA